MTKDERFDGFWSKYRGLNSKAKVKAKEAFFKAEQRWLKRNTDKAEQDFLPYVLNRLDMDMRHREVQQRAKQFVAPWPYASTYLNQDRFEDEFDEPIGELQEKANALKYECQIDGCEQNESLVYKGGYWCQEHFREYADQDRANELRHFWKKANERVPKKKDESHYEHHRRYVAHIRRTRGILPSLPYNRGERLSEGNMSEEDVLREAKRIEADRSKEDEYRAKYGWQ